jgi:hypothetical protein
MGGVPVNWYKKAYFSLFKESGIFGNFFPLVGCKAL